MGGRGGSNYNSARAPVTIYDRYVPTCPAILAYLPVRDISRRGAIGRGGRIGNAGKIGKAREKKLSPIGRDDRPAPFRSRIRDPTRRGVQNSTVGPRLRDVRFASDVYRNRRVARRRQIRHRIARSVCYLFFFFFGAAGRTRAPLIIGFMATVDVSDRRHYIFRLLLTLNHLLNGISFFFFFVFKSIRFRRKNDRRVRIWWKYLYSI